ncbi:MAG: DUF4399 domain-containing protein [Pseudomonadota bacterium]
MKRTVVAAAALAALATHGSADGHKTPYPEGASVYFINIEDGASVSSPVLIQFGLRGMGVGPAGTVDWDNVGHHHLLVNRAPMGEGENANEWDETLPNNDNHRHFGGGQTEVTLELPAGTHTLQMVFADYAHVPFGPDLVTDQITITVE